MDSDQKKKKNTINKKLFLMIFQISFQLVRVSTLILWEMMSLFTLLHCMVVNVLCNSHGTAKKLREGKIKQWSITCIYIASVLISAEIKLCMLKELYPTQQFYLLHFDL